MRQVCSGLTVTMLLLTGLVWAAAREARSDEQATFADQQANYVVFLKPYLSYQPGTRVFTGVVNGQYDVVVRLFPQADAATVGGEYYFTTPEATVINRLKLDGLISDNALRLDEVDMKWGEEVTRKPALELSASMSSVSELPTRLRGFWISDDKRQYCELRERKFTPPIGLRWISRSLKRSFPRSNYRIDMTFPSLATATGTASTQAVKFNREVERSLFASINLFKENMRGNEPIAGPNLSPQTGKPQEGPSYGLVGMGNVLFATPDLATVHIDEDADWGGAHGSQWDDFVTFDFRRGKAMRLSELFRPQASYLNSLSTLCSKALRRHLAANGLLGLGLEEGSAPKPENYNKWGFTPSGLLIAFGRYQVGDVGTNYVVIPYVRLRNIMKPEIYRQVTSI